MSAESDDQRPPNQVKAETLLAGTYRRFLQGLRVVGITESLVTEGLEHTRDLAKRQAVSSIQRVMTNKEYRIFSGPTPTLEVIGSMAEAMTSASLQTYLGAVKAARLIFWHSILDGVAADLCRVVAIASPERWEADLAEKTVRVREVRSDSYEKIRSRLLGKRLKELERDSLANKIAVLYDRCSAAPDWSGLHGYSFDLAALRRIDGLRHEIVHGNGLEAAPNLDEADIAYLRSTTLHLVLLVATHLGLKVDSREVFVEAAALGGIQSST